MGHEPSEELPLSATVAPPTTANVAEPALPHRRAWLGRADFLCALLLLVLPCLFFWPALVGRAVLLPLDNLLQMEPWSNLAATVAPGFTTPHNGLILDMIIQNLGWKRFLADQLRQGHLPLWNPYMLGGAPFLAAGQYQVLYPFGLLFVLLPAAWAYGPYTALHFGLAGVFTFAYLRLIGERRPGALVGAIAFAFCGSLVTSVVWPQMVGAMVWLPAVLACVELLLRATRHEDEGASARLAWPRATVALAAGSAAIALQIFAGHLEISFYVLSTAAAYTLWRLVPGLWRGATRRTTLAQSALLLAMGGLGVGLAAVQLLPFAEAISHNFRQNSVTLADVRGWALPVRQFVTFILPDFFGNPSQHTYFDVFSGHIVPVGPQADGTPTGPPQTAFWGIKNYVEAASYVGLLPLLLAPLGLFGRRNRYAGFFAAAGFVALLLAFGTPLYGLLFRFVPGFSQVHTAFRWVYVYEFAVACLAAMGANWALEHAAQRGVRRPATNVAAADGQSPPAQTRTTAADGPASDFGDEAMFGHGASARSPSPAARARGPKGGVRASPFPSLYGVAALLFGLGAAGGVIAAWLLKGRLAASLQARILADAAQPKSAWFIAGRLHDGREWLSLVWGHAAWAALVLLASGLLLFVLLTLRCRERTRRVIAVLLPLVVVADLFAVSMPFNTLASPALLSMTGAGAPYGAPAVGEPAAVAWLQARVKSEPPFRIASFGPQDVLAPNSAMLYGLQDVRGYDTIVLSRYARFLDKIAPQMGNLNLYSQTTKTFTDPAALQSPLFRLLNVRYVLATTPIQSSAVTLVHSGPVNVYAVPAALPRAFIVPSATVASNQDGALAAITRAGFDPARQVVVEGAPDLALSSDSEGTATISSYQSGAVTLDVDTSGPSYLVLADTYFPGWTARVRPADGQGDWRDLSVLPADEAFRAVRLDRGHWTVEFRYQPLSFRTGLVLSSLSAGVLALALVAAGWGALNRRLDINGNAARRVAKNALSPMASNFANKVLDFGFNVFTALIIGPAGIGRFAEAVAVVTLLSTVQDFGLSTITMRDVAADHSLAARYFKNTLLLRLGLAVLAVPATALIVLAGSLAGAYDHATVLTLWLLVAGFFPGSAAAAASGVLKGTERFEAPALLEVAANLLRLLVGTLTLLLGWNVVGLAVTSLLVNVFNAVALGAAVRAWSLWRGARVEATFCLLLLRESFALMLNNLLNLVFFRVDVLLLTFLLKDQSLIGYYSVAYKFIDGLGFVSAYLTGALFPVMSRLARESLTRFREVYLFAVRLLVNVALPATAVVLVLADRIIMLFYPQFLPSIPLLRILILFLLFSYVNGITQYALIAVGKQSRITRAFILGVAFNIAFNLVGIPRFGVAAAAWATVLSELVLMGPFLRELWFAIAPFPLGQVALRPVLAAAGTAAVALALHGASWLLLIPACLVAYPALLLLLGGLPARERRQLADLFGRRTIAVGEGA